MPRKLRMEYAGAIYHVMNRGDRREDIFKDDVDRERFLADLGEACGKTQWQIHAYGRGQAIVWFVFGFTNLGKCWGMVGTAGFVPGSRQDIGDLVVGHVRQAGENLAKRLTVCARFDKSQAFSSDLSSALASLGVLSGWCRSSARGSVAKRSGLTLCPFALRGRRLCCQCGLAHWRSFA